MTQIRRYAPDLILTLILFCLLIIVLIVPIEISYTLSEQKTPNNQMVDFLVEEPSEGEEEPVSASGLYLELTEEKKKEIVLKYLNRLIDLLLK